MSKVTLTWVDDNVVESGYYIYRSTSPMDVENLPAPYANLAANVSTFTDSNVASNTVYYYRVSPRMASNIQPRWVSSEYSATGAPEWKQDDLDVYWNFEANKSWNGLPEVPITSVSDTWSGGLVQSSNGFVNVAANSFSISDLGMQVVPPRVNSLRNNSMAGAAVGNTGTLPTNWVIGGSISGLNREVVSLGSSNNLPYIDLRIWGTANSSTIFAFQFETSNTVVAEVNQTWTGSTYLALVAGSTRNISSITFRPARGFAAANATTTDSESLSITDLDASMKRYSMTTTLADATTIRVAPQLTFTYSSGAVIDITVRVWAPQMELGSFATPPIMTSGSTVTQSGNMPVIALSDRDTSMGFCGFLKVDLNQLPMTYNSINSRLISFSDGSDINRVIIVGFPSTNQLSMQGSIGGASLTTGSTASNYWSTGIQTFVFAFSPGFWAIKKVGGSQTTISSNAVMPYINRVSLLSKGVVNADGNTYGFVKRFALKYGPANQSTFDAMYALAEQEHLNPPILL